MRASPPKLGSRGPRAASRTPSPDAARQFKEILQRVRIPALIINERGVFTWMNDAFTELFGYRVGEHYASIVATEYRRAADIQFARKLNGAPVTDYRIEAVARDGRRSRSKSAPFASIGRTSAAQCLRWRSWASPSIRRSGAHI
jgi:PAS domain-containing protein